MTSISTDHSVRKYQVQVHHLECFLGTNLGNKVCAPPPPKSEEIPYADDFDPMVGSMFLSCSSWLITARRHCDALQLLHVSLRQLATSHPH